VSLWKRFCKSSHLSDELYPTFYCSCNPYCDREQKGGAKINVNIFLAEGGFFMTEIRQKKINLAFQRITKGFVPS